MLSRKSRQFSLAGGALDAAFARLGLSGRLAQQRAVIVWPEVVGPQVAAATRALGVRDGVLFVAARSTTWAHELILRKRGILQAIERELGENTLTDIRFLGRGFQDQADETASRRMPLPDASEWQSVPLTEEDRENISRTSEAASDPELRSLLERVMADSMRVRRWKEEHGWAKCRVCGLPHQEESDLCALCQPRQATR